jgi:hypothetical protein
MYKKTTTTIVEELDSADSLNLKASPVKGIFSNFSDENSNVGIAYRHSMMKIYARLVRQLREVLVNKQSSPEAMPAVMEYLNAVSNGFETLIVPYLGAANGAIIVPVHREVVAEMANVLDLIASGKDSAAAEQMVRSKIIDLDKKITGAFFPSVLPEGSVAEFWNGLLNSIIQQANSRNLKDWGTDQNALNGAFEIMVFGQPTGVSGFGDVLAKAIIRANPGRNWV